MDSKQPKKPFLEMAVSATREILAVIVAILLALAINEWWEDHERSVRKTELIEKLYSEIHENLVLLQDSHQHHTEQLQVIHDRIVEKQKPTEEDYIAVYRELYRKGIFKPALLTNTNWEIAKLTNLISYMDMEDLRSFTRVFALQDMHQSQWDQNAQAQIFADAQENPSKLIEFYFSALNETWWAEKQLLEALQAIIADQATSD